MDTRTGESMSEKSNFRPRVVEAPSLGVELEFHEQVRGLGGDTAIIYLRAGATMRQAEQLRDMIRSLGWTFTITNPK